MTASLHRALLLLVFLAASAHGHEIRPAYMQLTEQVDGSIQILWRLPVMGAYAAPLEPRISTGWLDQLPSQTERTAAFHVRQWHIPAPRAELSGVQLEIRGLERTITDVLVRVVYADGQELTHRLTPAHTSFRVPSPGTVTAPVREYLALGFEHIWHGADHLLYVLGLMLLVRNGRMLIKTITSFTVAHSLSLGAAAAGYVDVPVAPVEAVIALSIVYVALEVLRARRGGPDGVQGSPWRVAFCFGLLHGLGFAGALSDIGLPSAAIPTALLLFNSGIEIGQLSFIAVLLTTGRLLVRAAPGVTHRLQWLPPYAIGAVASFWLIERVYVFL